MTLRFCVLIGRWTESSVTEVYDTEKTPGKGVLLPMSKYNPKIGLIAQSRLVQLRHRASTDPDAGKWSWRLQSMIAAARCPEILAINFSPRDPTKIQPLHVEKQQGDELTDEKKVYFHLTTHYRFLLPVEEATDTFISQSAAKLEGVDGKTRYAVEKILGIFWQDQDANGLAVTLKQGTYLWLK